MPTVVTWLAQFILVCIPLATGIFAYRTSKRSRAAAKEAAVLARQQPAPALNGSYAIIQACLDRLKTVQSDYEALHTRYVHLEVRLSECEKARKAPSVVDVPVDTKTARRPASASTARRTPRKKVPREYQEG